jgi:hypothetical protein
VPPLTYAWLLQEHFGQSGDPDRNGGNSASPRGVSAGVPRASASNAKNRHKVCMHALWHPGEEWSCSAIVRWPSAACPAHPPESTPP